MSASQPRKKTTSEAAGIKTAFIPSSPEARMPPGFRPMVASVSAPPARVIPDSIDI